MNWVRPGRRRRFRVPRGTLGDHEPPFQAALGVGRRRDRERVGLAIVAALGAHVLVAWLAWFAPAKPPPAPVKKEIPVIVAARPPPPPPPTPPPPPPPPRHTEARRVRTPPPPAQAAKVIARAPDPLQPVDMTSFTMPEGQADAYAGGQTSGSGTSKTAVMSEQVKPNAPPGPPVNCQAHPPLNLTQDWNCPWPQEEASSDRNSADAVVNIRINADGDPTDVRVSNSPGASFAAAAKACPFDQHFKPAVDCDGKPVPGEINGFVIHFVR